MADPESKSPPPEDIHWGISYLREDLQDVKQDMREFRKEVAAEFASFRKEVATEFANVRREMAAEFANVRQEMAQQFADMRKEMALNSRNNLMIMIGLTGIFASIVIAFIQYRQYRLPGG